MSYKDKDKGNIIKYSISFAIIIVLLIGIGVGIQLITLSKTPVNSDAADEWRAMKEVFTPDYLDVYNKDGTLKKGITGPCDKVLDSGVETVKIYKSLGLCQSAIGWNTKTGTKVCTNPSVPSTCQYTGKCNPLSKSVSLGVKAYSWTCYKP